ncbi:beta-glucosidase [Gelidibacter algens]|uniref:Beta-glucosidase n=2 Tax=Gelidibacter algens TaxID=49280 RepID=A0A1A7R568_9FLAO|nr:glycoside hydrolase family 3 C-terminal domain-containing protein [Gelidibacter algens]OBX27006.1 glycosyl hydrolase [Gelidibacter algens]RAJ28053.1 beta-glucosidase [Gelidibacter algens]
MNRKIVISISFLVVILCIVSCSNKVQYKYSFQNPSLPLEERVDNLVSLMTIEEKISQMVNNAPAIERLDVPAYNWWNETLHGVARSPYNVTSYPQAIGMAAGWNPASLQTMADYCATEGRAIYNDSQKKGNTGIYLGLTYWSPNINIFRDPRWGRGQETYGEDPFLTGTLGKAFVRGIEGDNPNYLKASACAKHYAVHSGPEWNRSTFNAEVSDYDLWNTYLPAFKDLIVDAKVSGVMCAYNALDGQPCCANDKLMNTILREKWNFTGYVTSDCGGINHFWKTHKTHPNKESAAAAAVLHGTDCECSSDPAYNALSKALADGLLTENDINTSVKRLFTIRFRLGMFDPPSMVPFSDIDVSVLEHKKHKEHALKMARESMVLLKNENKTLPISKSIKKIAIVGPNAADESVLLSNYYGSPSEVTSVVEGIRAKFKGEIIYEQGVNIADNEVFKSQYNQKLFTHNGVEGFNGAYYKNTKFEGEPTVVKLDKTVDFQWADGEFVADGVIANSVSMRWTSEYTADRTAEVTFSLKGDDHCKLFVDGEKKIETDLKTGFYTFQATKGKTYKLVIELVQYSDNAEVKFDAGFIEKLSPLEISNRVKDADVIVFVGGISASLEGEAMPVSVKGFKGGDRTNIELPAVQTEVLKALHATGKPVVFINMSGGAMGFEWEAENIPAIIQAWYAGQEGGAAIADVLFGDYNPAGRLPVTFYKNVNQLPDFEDYNMNNRTYRYFKEEPLYAFGYGLSYSTFAYSNLEIVQSDGEEFIVSANVTNTGKFDGDEVVQLYVSNKNDEKNKSIRDLKGFKRIILKAGETKGVTFNLKNEDLSILDDNGNSLPLKGTFDFSLGGGQPNEKSQDKNNVITTSISLN